MMKNKCAGLSKTRLYWRIFYISSRLVDCSSIFVLEISVLRVHQAQLLIKCKLITHKNFSLYDQSGLLLPYNYTYILTFIYYLVYSTMRHTNAFSLIYSKLALEAIYLPLSFFHKQ